MRVGQPGKFRTPSRCDVVTLLTRWDGETYDAFIEHALTNPLARNAKLGDLEDNMAISRVPNPTGVDITRVEEVRAGRGYLEGRTIVRVAVCFATCQVERVWVVPACVCLRGAGLRDPKRGTLGTWTRF